MGNVFQIYQTIFQPIDCGGTLHHPDGVQPRVLRLQVRTDVTIEFIV